MWSTLADGTSARCTSTSHTGTHGEPKGVATLVVTMMMMMIVVQAIFYFSSDPSRVENFESRVLTLTGQCKTFLSCASGSRTVENHAKCVHCGQAGRWRAIKTKPKYLRRGATGEPRPLKRRRTSEVLAEIETSVTEKPRQTLSVLRWHSSLDMSGSTLWRALQARPCIEIDGSKPLGKIELLP